MNNSSLRIKNPLRQVGISSIIFILVVSLYYHIIIILLSARILDFNLYQRLSMLNYVYEPFFFLIFLSFLLIALIEMKKTPGYTEFDSKTSKIARIFTSILIGIIILLFYGALSLFLGLLFGIEIFPLNSIEALNILIFGTIGLDYLYGLMLLISLILVGIIFLRIKSKRILRILGIFLIIIGVAAGLEGIFNASYHLISYLTMFTLNVPRQLFMSLEGIASLTTGFFRSVLLLGYIFWLKLDIKS